MKVLSYESTKVLSYFRTFESISNRILSYESKQVISGSTKVLSYESTSDEVSSDYNVYTMNEL